MTCCNWLLRLLFPSSITNSGPPGYVRMSMGSPPKTGLSSPQAYSIRQFLLAGAWFGLLTGLIEGAGLLIFQRVNWENWGRMLHVPAAILWVSPPAGFFHVRWHRAGMRCNFKIVPRAPLMRVAFFLFSALAVYDWLCLTGRLYPLACLSMGIGAGVVAQRWVTNHEPRSPAQEDPPWVFACACLAFVAVEGNRWWDEHHAVASLPPAPPPRPTCSS